MMNMFVIALAGLDPSFSHKDSAPACLRRQAHHWTDVHQAGSGSYTQLHYYVTQLHFYPSLLESLFNGQVVSPLN